MDRDNRFRIVSVAVIALAVMAGVFVSARLTKDHGTADAHSGVPMPRTGSLYGPSAPEGGVTYEDGCAPDPKSPAKLRFELEADRLDLGLVKQGETIERTVNVRNAGTGVPESPPGCVRRRTGRPRASRAFPTRARPAGRDVTKRSTPTGDPRRR
jgi:hypothetical protein